MKKNNGYGAILVAFMTGLIIMSDLEDKAMIFTVLGIVTYLIATGLAFGEVSRKESESELDG